jgi:hypothetical protein
MLPTVKIPVGNFWDLPNAPMIGPGQTWACFSSSRHDLSKEGSRAWYQPSVPGPKEITLFISNQVVHHGRP